MRKEFKIPTPKTLTNKSVRFPNAVIERVEEAIKGTKCNFSLFVVEAVKNALDDLDEQKKE